MNVIKKWIRNVFGFSGKEINGFVILLPLVILAIASEPLYRMWIVSRKDDRIADQRMLDSLVEQWNKKTKVESLAVKHSADKKLFLFDPNLLDEQSLQRLGFSKILSTRIVNYRKKGGHFVTKADLRKIYGIDSAFYSRIYNYIDLPQKIEAKKQPETHSDKKITDGTKLFDINTADTAQLKSIYGIGPALANRILKFRDALGGFNKIDQLKEIYGLDSVVVDRLKKVTFINNNFNPVKININTASEKALASHPYIKKFIAKAIVAYRFQHGNFNMVDDLRKLTIVKANEADKIIPYITVDD